MSKVGHNFVILDWKPPLKDGGSKVTSYLLEKCEASSEDWVKVDTVKAFETSYKIADLKTGVEYLFAVSAENKAGLGEPNETPTPVVPQRPPGKHCHISYEDFCVISMEFFQL